MTRTSSHLRRADRIPELFAPAVVDLFSGAGGWSIGAERAFVAGGHRDRFVDLAVNHWRPAITCHAANHPLTEHRHASVFEIDPNTVLRGREIAYLHASPDCTHFSRARGSRPVKKKIRGLAWVVVDWARKRRPSVITLENVEEFQTWGPIGDDGQPDPGRRGETFEDWVGTLRSLGYAVDWRVLRACDYGAPTTRRRLYIIARCDGRPIVWPKPTHGGDGQRPFATAADCIDWTEPMCSIFATPEQARAWAKRYGRHTPVRPLAEKTLRRIARGTMRYVVDAAEPFIVQLQNGSSTNGTHAIGRPFPTVTANPKGGGHALVTPFLIPRHGEREGQAMRCRSIEEPMPTVTGAGNGASLVAAFLAKHYGGVTGQPLNSAIGTVTGVDHHSLAAVHLTHFYTSNTRGGEGDMRHPLKTVTGGGQHAGVVAAFLQTYYGQSDDGIDITAPCPTVTGTDRVGLVTVDLAGEPWIVADIAMRMLTPRELARAQGFADEYVIDRGDDGRLLTKRDQVKLIGNSVCPPVAEAIVRANVVEQGILNHASVIGGVP